MKSHLRRWRTRNTYRGALAAMMLLPILGAGSPAAAASRPDSTPRDVFVDGPRLDSNPVDQNQALAEVDRAVGGFGGAWVKGDATLGEDEVLHLWLMNPNDRSAANESRAQLRVHLGERFHQERIILHKADFTWTQLNQWFSRASGLLKLPGAAALDIDETRNRIVLSIEEPQEHAAAVENALTRLGVPTSSVVVEYGRPERIASSLRGHHRPIIGGLQFQFVRPQGVLPEQVGTCTVGYTAVRNGELGFITNSHCSVDWGAVDAGPAYQPEYLYNTFLQNVAYEKTDPKFTSSISNCPSGEPCRHSDSNFYRRNPNDVENAEMLRGYIARPDSGTAWSGVRWRVVDTDSAALDVFVHKVGRTSGDSGARVTATCAVVKGVDPINTSVYRYFVCQDRAAALNAQAGDSGAPVFRVTHSPKLNDVHAMGLLWGSTTFSRISLTKTELGIDVGGSPAVKVCASVFSC